MAPATDEPEITLRRLGSDDVAGCVEVLIRAFNEFDAAHGFPPPFHTFSQAEATVKMALTSDPQGVWGAVTDRGKVVGMAVGYRRGEYLSIGPVAVHPIVQHRGVGRRLMLRLIEANPDAAWMVLSHAGVNTRAFMLYRRAGFRVLHADCGFVGVPPRVPAPPPGVEEAGTRDLERIKELDRELARVDRSRDLEMLARMGRAYLHRDGYLIATRLGRALGVGPGAASDGDALAALLAAALQDLPAGGLMLRCPANGHALDVLADCGMTPQGVGNTMVRGRVPDRAGEHVYPVFPEVL